MKKEINVPVVYADNENQIIVDVLTYVNASVKDVIIKSDILNQINTSLDEVKVGIFGELCDLQYKLSNGDRVEIYTDLLINPKDARRIRAANNPVKKVKNIKWKNIIKNNPDLDIK